MGGVGWRERVMNRETGKGRRRRRVIARDACKIATQVGRVLSDVREAVDSAMAAANPARKIPLAKE